VSLQLDELSKLMTRAKRRDALRTLLKTLDHFYHRLLEDIDQSHVEVIMKALTWLLFSARPLTVSELADAVIIHRTKPYIDSEDRFDNEECILSLLPAGFVSTSVDNGVLSNGSSGVKREGNSISCGYQAEDFQRRNLSPTVKLSHHSVKNYLLSARVTKQAFKIEQISASKMIQEACMAYLLSAWTGETTEKEIFDDLPLLEYFCGCWPYHLENVVGHDKILLHYRTSIYLGKSSNTRIIHGEEGFVFAESLSSQCSRG
jgi:hypothetical protein